MYFEMFDIIYYNVVRIAEFLLMNTICYRKN